MALVACSSHIPYPKSHISYPASHILHPISHILSPTSHIPYPAFHIPHPTSHHIFPPELQLRRRLVRSKQLSMVASCSDISIKRLNTTLCSMKFFCGFAPPASALDTSEFCKISYWCILTCLVILYKYEDVAQNILKWSPRTWTAWALNQNQSKENELISPRTPFAFSLLHSRRYQPKHPILKF